MPLKTKLAIFLSGRLASLMKRSGLGRSPGWHWHLNVLPLILDLQDTCPNGRLTKKVFKRISSNPNSDPSPNSKAQKCFRENEMTSFFGKMFGYL